MLLLLLLLPDTLLDELPIGEPVDPVPALALGEAPAVSSGEREPAVGCRELESEFESDWPHFINDCELSLSLLLLFRRDQRNAPAAATAVAAAAAATGRDLAMSIISLMRPERWPERSSERFDRV